MPEKTDVAVVGGGVVGIACALELAREGAHVLVLERDRAGFGCSFGNAGWMTPSLALPLANPSVVFKSLGWLLDPESPLYIQPRLDPAFLRWLAGFMLAARRSRFERGAAALLHLCNASVDLWEELARRSPEPFGFQRHGLIAVYEDRPSLEKARGLIDLLAKNGVRSELWSSDEVREREPAIVGAQVGGWFFPDDAHCEPYPAVRALAREALHAGVRIAEDTELYRVASNGSGPYRLVTTHGVVAADRVVLAAGAWSAPVAAAFGLRVPILGAKGYSLVLPRLEPHPTRSIYLIERKIAVNPHADALRVSGTLELVRDDMSINERRLNAILRGSQGMLAIPSEPVIREVWRGLRPCAPDGMPLIGRARGRGDVWLATGHQMTGLKTALGTARLLAELMAGRTPSFDPEPFRADRY
ncbi:MAG: NAD(P)/FAD-dependent oxidoreductase [Acidobacteriota bacterium]